IHENSVRNTAASAISKSAKSRKSGITRTKNGNNQSAYWGEYTLLVSRKSTSIGKARVHTGGGTGLRNVARATTRTPTRNAMSDAMLIKPIERQPACPTIAHVRYQSVPGVG